MREAVFTRFWRGDGARSEVGSHVGLGLALAERILQVLGHSISVETELDGWFQVRVRFSSAVPTPRSFQLRPSPPMKSPAPCERSVGCPRTL